MIVFRRETIGEARGHITPLIPAQYAETGDADLPPVPNWRVYEALEQADCLVMIVVFDERRPIGYAGAALHPAVNSMTTSIGSVTTWYVEERPGRAFIVRRLLEHMQELLFAAGAAQVKIETEYGHSVGRLLERMGYAPDKIGYKISARRSLEQRHA